MTEIKKNWFERVFTNELDTKVSKQKRFWFLIISPFVMIGLFFTLTHPGSFAPFFFIPVVIISLCLKLFALKTLRNKYQKVAAFNEDAGLKNMVIILASVVFWLLFLLAVSAASFSP